MFKTFTLISLKNKDSHFTPITLILDVPAFLCTRVCACVPSRCVCLRVGRDYRPQFYS